MQKDWDVKKVKTIHARFVDNWLINQATDEKIRFLTYGILQKRIRNYDGEIFVNLKYDENFETWIVFQVVEV